jgi:predicted lipoprotein with Yx(FWY)xxD motif
MRRIPIVLAGLLASAMAAGAVAGAQAPLSAHAAKLAKLQLRHTKLGSILVDGSGFTVYRFTRDSRKKDTCVTMKAPEGYGSMSCSEVWPPLTTSGRPIAAAGVKASLLSTIALPGGRKQVTYAGYPLYLYAPASERGETRYIGVEAFGGRWDAVSAAGKLVK